MRGFLVKHGSRIEGDHLVFDKGDVLEWHIHTKEANDSHVLIVARGELLLETRGHAPAPIALVRRDDKTEVWGGENVVIGAGDLLDVPLDIDHQFTGLTDVAEIFAFAKEILSPRPDETLQRV